MRCDLLRGDGGYREAVCSGKPLKSKSKSIVAATVDIPKERRALIHGEGELWEHVLVVGGRGMRLCTKLQNHSKRDCKTRYYRGASRGQSKAIGSGSVYSIAWVVWKFGAKTMEHSERSARSDGERARSSPSRVNSRVQGKGIAKSRKSKTSVGGELKARFP